MIMFFKKKCRHDYEEIGRYYREDGYGNGNVLNACIVYKCLLCGNIRKDWIYNKNFLPYAKIETIDKAVMTLKKNGFVKELDFQISQIGKQNENNQT